MNLRVDLNADMGEGAGHDEQLLALISSANIATGVHAGDAASVLKSIQATHARGVAVGAHPGFADRENFGRSEMAMNSEDIYALVLDQLTAFQTAAQSIGSRLNHVKPHGALYNMAARDADYAGAIVRAILKVAPTAVLFAPGRSELSKAAAKSGLALAREVFADRNYQADGSLVPRARGDALLHDPQAAAERVLRMLKEGVVRSVDGTEVPVQVETICVHGDTPQAVVFARELRDRLIRAGFEIGAPR